jgi:hypothetical protein
MVSYDAAPVYAILGNIAKIEETGDTGEPFLIRVGRYRDNYPSEYQIYAFDCATELTLSIRHYVETINKLSGKYVEGMGWSEKSTKEVLPETFVAEPAQQESGLNLYQINCALAGGKKYTVIYNGAAYDVISRAIDEDSVLAGNFAVVGDGDDTGEPFLISYNANLGGTMVGTLDGGGITISIYGEGETIHPIDKKYLPTLTVNIDKNGVADKTFDEIMEAEQGGYSVELMETTDDGIKFKYTRIGNEFVCVDLVDSELYIYVCEYSWDDEKWQTTGARLDMTIS